MTRRYEEVSTHTPANTKATPLNRPLREMVKGENKGFAFASINVDIAPDLSKWRAEIPAHSVLAAAEALMGPTSDGKSSKLIAFEWSGPD